MTRNTQARIRILVYYVIAVALSGIFRLGLFPWYDTLALPGGLTDPVKSLCEGSGPITGALVIALAFHKKSDISLFGTRAKKSLMMAALPIALFTILGANNNADLNRHLYGFIIGLAVVLYGVFEEYGWRGYLQDELKGLKPAWRLLLISVLWYLWHLSFLAKGATVFNQLIFFTIIVFASWGIGAIAEKTKSVVASACFHILGNILLMSSLIATVIDYRARYIVFGLCLIAWIYMVNIWNKGTSHAANNTTQGP